MPRPLSFTGAHWRLLDVPEDHLATVRSRSGLSAIAARCMAVRWSDTVDRDALTPSMDALHDPMTMAGMDEALALLREASEKRWKVRIITDYDVDGTTSSLILQAVLGLACPGITLDYDIPDRFRDGYGFSPEAARRAANDGVDLIVTADIGVRDHAAVAAAREAGTQVLICDHHLPEGADVPSEAVVLCPPQAACNYPNRHLAACGVSLKLGQALLAQHNDRDRIVRSLLKLAAIGTVADLVPLTGAENRAIVAMGLDALNRDRHAAGLQALLDIAGLERGHISEEALGFQIGPRINAAGRVAHADLAVRLISERDPSKATALARELDELNLERRRLQATLVSRILDDLSVEPKPFVVVAGREEDGFHRGVVGIVAARLKDKLHRPVAVVSIQGDRAVASVRSVPGVHAVEALSSCDDLLVKFGGHPSAAGFTVDADRLPELESRLCEWVDTHSGPDALVAERDADAVASVGDLNDALLSELQTLGPFGMGNPPPRLLLRGVEAAQARIMGKAGDHLSWMLHQPGQRGLQVVWWRHANLVDEIRSGPIDVLGSLKEHRWRGQRRLQFTVQDVRAAE